MPGRSAAHDRIGLALLKNLAVLKAKRKITDSGRNRLKTYDLLRKMAVRTLPRDPPGQGQN